MSKVCVWSRGCLTGKERGQMMTEKRRAWVELDGWKDQGVTGELRMASEVGGQTVLGSRG